MVVAITGVLLGSIRGGGIPSCGERVGVAKGLELSLGRWAAALASTLAGQRSRLRIGSDYEPS